MNLNLVVLRGKLKGREIPVRTNEFLIGRDPQCHLRPSSPLISKKHCAIVLKGDRAYLRDVASTNGTILNHASIAGEVELSDGDVIRAGPLDFRVIVEGGLKPVAPEAKPKTPKPSETLASSEDRTVDEDALAEMFLNLGDEGQPGADPVPQGSTLMAELPPETPEGAQGPETKKTVKKVIDAKATSDAAAAILDKYLRRPRA